VFFNQHIKPSFIIIGGIKCATSSLYRYLNLHPNILPCKTKEPMIFNTSNIFKTFYKLPWYFSLFPKKEFTGFVQANWVELSANDQLVNSIFKKQKEAGVNYIVGEASAGTFTQAYPWLVKKILPNIKLVVLLRNPTSRFISHYKMNIRFTKEGRKQHQPISLDDFITKQINDFNKGDNKNELAQGIYTNHLNRWLKYFNRNQLYIGKTDDLANPVSAQKELNNIFRFLGLPEYDFGVNWKKFNASKSSINITEAKIRLDQFYQPCNNALTQQFNIQF